MAKKTYGIDFGTDTIKVYKNGSGIILMEKCAVSTVGPDNRPVAIGEQAYEMFEKAPPSIHVSLPLKRGVVACLEDMIALWNYMGQAVFTGHKKNRAQCYIAVPADITQVEKQAYSKIITKSENKPQKVVLIDKPIADAYGLNLDIENMRGIMIVNLGADTTEISVLSLGGIVVSKLVPLGGNDFDRAIQEYVKRKYNYGIGLRTAEQLKIRLVSAVDDEEKTCTVVGTDVLKGLPGNVTISAREVSALTKNIFETIAAQISSMLEHTPPEVSGEIEKSGIYLTGGTSFAAGLDQFFANAVKVRVNTVQSAQKTVISGLGYLCEHPRTAAKYAVPVKL